MDEGRSPREIPYLFNGKELDSKTSLYYYGARYYDPGLSVWLSVDPLAEKYAKYTPYNFVMQNPIRLLDPDGMGAKNAEDWFGPLNDNSEKAICVDSNSPTFTDDNGTEYKNIGPDHIIDGPNNMIFHEQNKVVAVFDKSESIKHTSAGFA